MSKIIPLFGSPSRITKIDTNPNYREQNKLDELSEAGKKIFEAARPKSAVAVIVAVFQKDIIESEPIRIVILAWSDSTRNSFREMKKAAAKLEETKHLDQDDNPKKYEHRKNAFGEYDCHLAKYMYSGWQVRKKNLSQNHDKLYIAATQPENFLVNK